MKFSFTEVFQLCLFCVAVGIFVNQIDALKEKTITGIESINERIDSIDERIAANHNWTMEILSNQNIQIVNIQKFLEEKYPEFFVPSPTLESIKSYQHYRKWD